MFITHSCLLIDERHIRTVHNAAKKTVGIFQTKHIPVFEQVGEGFVELPTNPQSIGDVPHLQGRPVGLEILRRSGNTVVFHLVEKAYQCRCSLHIISRQGIGLGCIGLEQHLFRIRNLLAEWSRRGLDIGTGTEARIILHNIISTFLTILYVYPGH